LEVAVAYAHMHTRAVVTVVIGSSAGKQVKVICERLRSPPLVRLVIGVECFQTIQPDLLQLVGHGPDLAA